MAKGEGKGWSKGRTVANDSRVGNDAGAHTGMMCVRRTPPEDCKGPLSSITTLPIEWSPEMAYIVGLTATDGCLLTGFRKINFKSCDRDLVALYLRLLGRTNRIKDAITRTGGIVYFTEFGDTRLYRWMLTIGLTPRKSLTLGAIDVPDDYLAATLRGLFEGDGNIENFVDRPTKRLYPNYRYERLRTNFNSASRRHLEWIQHRVALRFGLTGYLAQQPKREGRHDFFRLRYSNKESVVLLSEMYPTSDVPKLERKWKIWNDYAERHGLL